MTWVTLCREQDAGALEENQSYLYDPQSHAYENIPEEPGFKEQHAPKAALQRQLQEQRPGSQIEFPSREERVKEEAAHTYSGRRLTMKQKEIIPTAEPTGPSSKHTKRRHSEKKGRYHMISLLKLIMRTELTKDAQQSKINYH